MKTLVTGGTGFIGSHLVDELVARGCEVTLVTRHPGRVRPEWSAVNVIEGLFTDEKVLNFCKEVEVVYHLAVYSDGPASDGETARRVNVDGSEAIARWAAGRGVKRFFFASSIEAQGPADDPSRPLREEDPCVPVSVYGESKRLAESAILKSGLSHVVIGRIGNTYGPRSHGFIPGFVRAYRKQDELFQSLRVMDDIRIQPIYVTDLVRAILCVVESEFMGTINLVGHENVRVGDWMRGVAELLNLRPGMDPPVLTMTDAEKFRQRNPFLDYWLGRPPAVHRLYSGERLLQLGFEPRHSLVKGTAYTLEWFCGQEKAHACASR